MLGVAVQLLDVSVLIARVVCCSLAAVIMNSCLLLNVQTLEQLHMKANICHLDLTITNVMLQDDRSNGWDALRLIDFGFAQFFNEGKLALLQSMLQGFRLKCLPALFLLFITQCQPTSLSDREHHGYALHCPIAREQVKLTACTVRHLLSKLFSLSADMLYIDVRTRDVKPTGATTPYAAPELLRSLQRQWEGAEDSEEFVMINGPAADIWSFACVCYQMLTGDLPFLPDHKPATSAPAILVGELHPIWEEYESIIGCHEVWVRPTLVLLVK